MEICQYSYEATPKQFNNSKWKPRQNLFSVLVDLTRRQYLLLNKAMGSIKDPYIILSIYYNFAGVNCSLGMKFENEVFNYFNNKNEFHCLSNDWITRGSHWQKYAFKISFSGSLMQSIFLDMWQSS